MTDLREAIARAVAVSRGHDPDLFDMMLICGPTVVMNRAVSSPVPTE
jgi:hypothetical protein